MPIFYFESKEKRIRREMQKLANEIAEEAARNFNFNPDENPVLKKFRRKMGLPLKRRQNK